MQRHRIWRLPVDPRRHRARRVARDRLPRARDLRQRTPRSEEDDEGNVVTEISRGQIIFSFAIAIGFALMLFKVGPALLTNWLPIDDTALVRDRRGADPRHRLHRLHRADRPAARTCKRVFEYHGAEHKTINALEGGSELTPEKVQKFSLIHPRCGTAFLLWVMVIGIFVFALVGRPVWYWLIVSRILLLPVIAGLAYELIRYAGKHQDNRVLMTLARAGALAAAADDARADARPDRGVDPRARRR